MPIKSLLKRTVIAATLVATVALAQTPYDEGQKALREQDWMAAADHFEQAIRDDQSPVDAAMYWRAYAYFKAGREREAERELRRLERRYPDSSWVREGQALRIEHQDPERAIEQVTGDDALLDDQLRLFALAQLMDRDPDRAMPLVLDLANNAESPGTRKDALFVLAVSDAPQARAAVLEFARASDDPGMRRSAVQILGTMDASAELRDLYDTVQDRDTKIAIIESISITGDTEMLKQILVEESDSGLRRAAINGIAMEDGDDAAQLLQQLYDSASSPEEKSTILHALIMMDEAGALALKILRTEQDPELQRKAIHVLGVMEETGPLGELYGEMSDRGSRRAILQAMAIAEDTEGLAHILRTEQDEELRAVAIQSLAINDNEGVAETLISFYPDASLEEKRAVIQSTLIMDDADTLLRLLKSETDPELKREMMQTLTIMDSEEADEYLFELMEKNG